MSLLVVILSLLPGFVWLLFYLREDLHPEPKRLLALVFMMGMVSAFFALVVERAINSSLPAGINQLANPLAISQLFYLLAIGAIEEFVKFGAAYMSVHKNQEFDEPVDAMIYMVAAGLGFATLENLGAISGSLDGAGTQRALLGSVLETTSLRFVGATLLHSLTSALVGYYWALGIKEMAAAKFLAKGLVLATVLHAIFNYLIISLGNLAYMVIFLVVIGFLVLSDFERLKRKKL